ncbi:hypothetical protein A2Z33_03535 [Candidatus Gottesmanbacteria bacterium RBG_16_52_11]|uniref:Uncharacterized protein n=1 Tax=Candidatus Gottesmanbacteria bacterium RBG_16_52_11 TaxID=1798374 RepID=A0A1F5YVJ6_9BACT|nr:MAG: hypothetical protein A2Z33_03535 [Candidatus Gottesmanbacteria bacterium RBG_16_52_11]
MGEVGVPNQEMLHGQEVVDKTQRRVAETLNEQQKKISGEVNAFAAWRKCADTLTTALSPQDKKTLFARFSGWSLKMAGYGSALFAKGADLVWNTVTWPPRFALKYIPGGGLVGGLFQKDIFTKFSTLGAKVEEGMFRGMAGMRRTNEAISPEIITNRILRTK